MEPRSVDRRAVGLAAAVLLVAAVAGWWAWPSLNHADDQLDVVVIDDGFLAVGRRSVELRVREQGQRIDWIDIATTDCRVGALVDEIAAADPERVVVSLTEVDCAAETLSMLARWPLIVVVQPGAPSVVPDGADVVDPTPLVGFPEPSLRLGCLWWEICPPERSVQVRDGNGGLNVVGAERVARLIAANV